MKQLTISFSDEFALAEIGHAAWPAHVDPSRQSWAGPHGGVVARLRTEMSRRVPSPGAPAAAAGLESADLS